jgi:hypothetical protein
MLFRNVNRKNRDLGLLCAEAGDLLIAQILCKLQNADLELCIALHTPQYSP